MKHLFSTTRLYLGFLAVTASSHAAAVNLSSWTAESYAAVAGFGAGNWVVAGGGSSVNQTVNGQPTMFVSDFTAQGTKVSGTIRVTTTGDDDYVGFVLGFKPGDSLLSSSDYLLIDWKQSSQVFDFGAPSASGGGNAPAGLAVSRVTGIPDADEFWQHKNLAGTPAGSGVTELARGTTLGNTGYLDNTDYAFTFDFGPNNLVVSVNGVQQLNIGGAFADGRLGFYNFSQEGVNYSAFTVDPGTFPRPNGNVPDSGSSIAFLGLGMMAVLAARRMARTRAGTDVQ